MPDATIVHRGEYHTGKIIEVSCDYFLDCRFYDCQVSGSHSAFHSCQFISSTHTAVVYDIFDDVIFECCTFIGGPMAKHRMPTDLALRAISRTLEEMGISNTHHYRPGICNYLAISLDVNVIHHQSSKIKLRVAMKYYAYDLADPELLPKLITMIKQFNVHSQEPMNTAE